VIKITPELKCMELGVWDSTSAFPKPTCLWIQ